MRLANDPQALYLNLGYLKYISGKNLSPANNNLCIASFILCLYKILLMRGIPLKDELGPNNNLLASCSLINLNFLLPLTTRFDESILLPAEVTPTFAKVKGQFINLKDQTN